MLPSDVTALQGITGDKLTDGVEKLLEDPCCSLRYLIPLSHEKH